MKQNIDYFDLVEDIDPAYIEEAEAVPKKQKHLLRTALLAAACLLLTAGVVFLVIKLTQGSSPLEPDKTDETEMATMIAPVFRCQILDISNGGAFSDFLSREDLDYNWGGGMYQSKTAAPEMTVTFEGEEYRGVYSYTYVPSGTGSVHDVYKPEIPKEGNYLYFEVESSTGELRFIDLAVTQLLVEDQQAKIISEQEIEEIALQWARKWTSLEDYEKEVEFRDTPDDDWDFYHYRFWSIVQGVETTDYVDLLVSNRGRLIFIGASQPGWSREHREELEEFPVEEAVRQGIEKSGFSSPTINTKRFGITKEGEVVLLLGLTQSSQGSSVLYVIALTGWESRPASEESDIPTKSIPDTENPVSETAEFVEYEGDMSRFFGWYHLFEEENNIYSYYEAVGILENGTAYLDAGTGRGQREYRWRAVNDHELAVFEGEKDLGIRLLGVMGANRNGYGRLMRSNDPDGTESQEYVRRMYSSEEWAGAYILWDEPGEKACPQFYMNEYGEFSDFNKDFYESRKGPFMYYGEPDLPVYWTRAFDDDENYSEFRNNLGEYLYSFVREGHFYTLYEGDVYRGKYLRFSNDCLAPGTRGRFSPSGGEECVLHAFDLTEEESILIDGLRSQYDRKEPCQMHVMGNQENDWILLYPDDFDQYYRTFYTLRPTEDPSVWELYAHQEDGSVTEAGKYLFTVQ